MAKKKKMDETTMHNIVRTAVKEAVAHIESDIAPDRIKSQQYFNGESGLKSEVGRSKVVATKVRDTVRAIKPSLMRIFMSSGRYVEYVPKGEKDIQFSTEATSYVHYKMEELGGFRILSDVFHDALLKKAGFAKVYYEEYTEAETHNLTGLSDLQREAVTMAEEVDVIEESLGDGGWDMKVTREKQEGDICIDTIPPEEFFIDENARSIEDFYVCGHRTDMRIGDLVGMGYDLDEVKGMHGTTEASDMDATEDEARRGYTADGEDDSQDVSMRRVMVTEAYMRMDVDGTGVPVMHRFLMGGSNYEMIDFEPWDDAPFAVFEVDPEPHTFFGRSVPDLIFDDQDASTSILRGILDNVALVNDPRTEVVEHNVDLDDILNNEIGAIVRVKQAGSVNPLVTPFVAGQTLGAMQYYDSVIDSKTGITKASMGLDPDALQSTTKVGVSATIQAAAGQTEVMARNLAEGGVTRMFKLMLKLVIKHSDAPRAMKMNGSFQDVDPRAWNAGMSVSVNVGLGTGREEEKSQAYRELLGLQMQVYQGYGPANGVVTLENITNTVTDMMAAVGIRNADRYFTQVTPEMEQKMAAQAAQAAQGQGGDPMQGLIAAEQIKAQTKAQSDAMNAQVKMQSEMMKDDRDRDKMAQDFALEVARIEGSQVNQAQVRAEQERDRY
ncbi:hypothetical protein [Lentibacter algarum]|uniref:portal protein n=1 Tax=Lentibacter algarum TaxID=576131 RepID=UPI0026EBD94B|nr:hypothetical protein [Lentibacter algarum]